MNIKFQIIKFLGKKFKKSKKKRYRKKKRYGKKTSRKQKNVFVGEMEMECLGLPSDAKHCLTEAGNDYANTREIGYVVIQIIIFL